jgi:hypothetical protein
MRGAAQGLAYLHSQRIIHGNSEFFCLLLSTIKDTHSSLSEMRKFDVLFLIT